MGPRIAFSPRAGVSEADRRGGLYVDTSALARVLLRESDRDSILAGLGNFERLVASSLLRVELMRVGLKNQLQLEARALLTSVSTVPITEARLDAAQEIAPITVATLDAIHLVTAVELHESRAIDAMLTFDRKLAAAAAHHGLDTLSPR